MNLYLKQKVFSWGDKFTVYDENGGDRYYVEGEAFSWGKKLHVYDLAGNEAAYIEQKLFSFLPKYMVYMNGREVAEVVKEFTFFKEEYSVIGPDWNVYGDFFDHEYVVSDGGVYVAEVSKEWFSWGDAYAIRIDDNVDEVLALSVVLVIDACIEEQRNN